MTASAEFQSQPINVECERGAANLTSDIRCGCKPVCEVNVALKWSYGTVLYFVVTKDQNEWMTLPKTNMTQDRNDQTHLPDKTLKVPLFLVEYLIYFEVHFLYRSVDLFVFECSNDRVFLFCFWFCFGVEEMDARDNSDVVGLMQPSFLVGCQTTFAWCVDF